MPQRAARRLKALLEKGTSGGYMLQHSLAVEMMAKN
jgi:hypothetical protein